MLAGGGNWMPGLWEYMLLWYPMVSQSGESK